MIRVVFVAGSGRSGTTLIDRLLGRARGAFSAGELQYVWGRGFLRNELCGCGEPVRSCGTWRAIADAIGPMTTDPRRLEALIADRRRVLSLAGAVPGAHSAARARYRAALAELYAAIAAETGATTIIDSSKNALYGAQVARLPGVRLSVVHVVRDSRAVAYSWASKKERNQPGEAFMVRHGALGSTARWVAHNVLAERLAAHADTYVRVMYERLAEDPAAALAHVSRELELELPPGFAETGTVELPPDHTCAGNPSRFQVGSVAIRPDVRWRGDYPRHLRWAVAGMSWPWLVRYGYRIRSDQHEDNASG